MIWSCKYRWRAAPTIDVTQVHDEVYLDVPGYENYFAEDALPIVDEEGKELLKG